MKRPSDLGEADPRLYVRLAARLRSQILAGEVAPGQRVPSITALSQELGCARQTCGKAGAPTRTGRFAGFRSGAWLLRPDGDRGGIARNFVTVGAGDVSAPSQLRPSCQPGDHDVVDVGAR
jgi:DNA-binding transcriptional MocR family regulator